MMSGFGKMKEVEETIEDTKKIPHRRKDPFAAIAAEIASANDNIGHTFTALIGHENTGKTAVVTYAYKLYVQNLLKEKQTPKQLMCIDFDGGAQANKSAFHPEISTMVCLEPYVYTQDDRTAIDYPATHDRVMKLLQYCVHNHEKIWGVFITGVDGWDSVCINNMRIQDLGLARDAISAADVRGSGKDSRRVEFQWDWGIRRTRFHQMTTLCRGLVKRGVKVFLETHLAKLDEDDRMSVRGWRPAWEKSTSGLVFQILLFEREDIYDDESRLTNQVFTATFEKSKTDVGLQGQRRTILTTEVGGKPKWFGLQELNDGTL
jgi:hypothetical protein